MFYPMSEIWTWGAFYFFDIVVYLRIIRVKMVIFLLGFLKKIRKGGDVN